jgi:hypothetical protein
MWFCKHWHNLKEGLIEKSKLAQYAYEEGLRVGSGEARILEIETNSRYRKYKESAHIECIINPISQPSLDISPLLIPNISNEDASSHRSVRNDRAFVGSWVSIKL